MPAAADKASMKRSFERVRDVFVQRWGEMGDCWGINRTMAEIHALLYISPEPLCTDDIMERLQISRGNASMNLRGLVDWGLISRVHKRGDRKEYFISETNVWSMFETIARQRKKREIEPVIEVMTSCIRKISDDQGEAMAPVGTVARVEAGPVEPELELAYAKQRLESMLEFLEAMNKLFDRFLEGGRDNMRQVLSMLIGAPIGPPPATARKPTRKTGA